MPLGKNMTTFVLCISSAQIDVTVLSWRRFFLGKDSFPVNIMRVTNQLLTICWCVVCFGHYQQQLIGMLNFLVPTLHLIKTYKSQRKLDSTKLSGWSQMLLRVNHILLHMWHSSSCSCKSDDKFHSVGYKRGKGGRDCRYDDWNISFAICKTDIP